MKGDWRTFYHAFPSNEDLILQEGPFGLTSGEESLVLEGGVNVYINPDTSFHITKERFFS